MGKGSAATTNITRGLFGICYKLETISNKEVITNPGLSSFLDKDEKFSITTSKKTNNDW
jgi:hypothetical protein